MQDNHFEELKQAEILQNRLTILRDIDEYTGKYYSQKWVRENILQQSEDDMKEIDAEIAEEGEGEEDEFGGMDQEPMDEPVDQEEPPEQT